MIVYFSKSISKKYSLNLFFDKEVVHYSKLYNKKPTSVLGWGNKSTSLKAKEYAVKKKIPYYALEDGFFRSYGLGVNDSKPYSLTLDLKGVYYDSSKPSDLEDLLNNYVLSNDEIDRSYKVFEAFRSLKLSKYNQKTEDLRSYSNLSNMSILVDQTYGDQSVLSSGGSENSFKSMLDTALSDSDGLIYIKSHPDVIAGKKKGYLYELAKNNDRCVFLNKDLNFWDISSKCRKVYTVSSQLGFEALMAGCEVHCFASPFYSSWGLTKDEVHVSRRIRKTTLIEMFFICYILYTKYFNPVLNVRCEIEDIILLIEAKKRAPEINYYDTRLLGFSRWKRKYAKVFLSTNKKFSFKSLFFKDSSVSWGVNKNKNTSYQVEDGFIRSVGLGLNHTAPISWVFDSKGIYYDATQCSDLEELLNTYNLCSLEYDIAYWLKNFVLKNNLTKYNLGKVDFSIEVSKKIILIPGQVENDQSIKYGCRDFSTNLSLVNEVRNLNPDAYIIFKPHPDTLIGGRFGGGLEPINALVDNVLLGNIHPDSIFPYVDEVHTMTSLMGFEALLRGKVVHVYGVPFYSGWGLTCDRYEVIRRNRVLSLEELVFISLALYPIYVSNDSSDIVDVKTALTSLIKSI